MKKITLANFLLLALCTTAAAQPGLGGALNNPVFNKAVRNLIPCEEPVIRDNILLPKYDENRIRSMINFNCAPQINAALEACQMMTDNGSDDCQIIVDNMLSRHYRAIVDNIPKW